MPTRRHAARLVLAVMAGATAAAAARAAEPYRADPKLVEAARQEGELVLYTTLIVDQIVRPMIKAFQLAVPGINVKYVRADGLALELRMTNEMRAGRIQSDAWCIVDGVLPLLQAGAFAEFEVPSTKGLPSALVDPRHRWVAVNLGIRSIAYNTSLIPAAQAPHSYRDLLDPRWKGKLVWNPKSMTGAWGLHRVPSSATWARSREWPTCRQLAKQEPFRCPSRSARCSIG